MVDSDAPDTIIERLQPVAGIAPLLDQSIGLTGYDQLMQLMLSDAPPTSSRSARSGGAVSDVPADAAAYGWREANFNVAALGTRASGLDTWWEKLLPHLEGLYLSFETATGPEVLARAFPPGHLTRLRALKRRYDPTGLFRDNFYIDLGAAATAA